MCGITICKLHGYVKCCTLIGNCCCSVAKSHLTLRPHGLQHARPPCLSPSPRVCSKSCPSSWWCCPTISSSAALFSFCLKPFSASGEWRNFGKSQGPAKTLLDETRPWASPRNLANSAFPGGLSDAKEARLTGRFRGGSVQEPGLSAGCLPACCFYIRNCIF